MPSGASAATIDDHAFAALLQRETTALHAFLRRLAGNQGDADDLLQDTLAKVWRLRGSFDPAGNAGAWLHRAAFRVFCDHRRQSRRCREREQAGNDAVHREAAATTCRAELRDELQHRLAVLPELERQILLGFHGDGLSLNELADRHALPVNTVKSHLHRARRRLRVGHEPGERT